MQDRRITSPTLLPRRQALRLAGGAGASLLLGTRLGETPASAQASCVLNPEMTEGPYWVDEKLNRADIRVDPSDGAVKPGLPLTLTINVFSVGSACAPLASAYVDVWHCDAGGLYSDVAANSTVGKKFLRGYLITDDSGSVRFTTIYPGWYRGRAVHIHLRVRTYSGTTVTGVFTSQLHFDDSVSDTVLSQAPYNTRGTRDTRNSNDMVYTGSATASRTLLTLARTDSGYDASINVGVNLAADCGCAPLDRLRRRGECRGLPGRCCPARLDHDLRRKPRGRHVEPLLLPTSSMDRCPPPSAALACRSTTSRHSCTTSVRTRSTCRRPSIPASDRFLSR